MQANSGDPDQTPHSMVSDLGLHYLPMSHKKDARHIWVKKCNYFAYLIRVAEIWLNSTEHEISTAHKKTKH